MPVNVTAVQGSEAVSVPSAALPEHPGMAAAAKIAMDTIFIVLNFMELMLTSNIHNADLLVVPGKTS